MSVVTVSSKGQIVLPKDLRQELNIQEGDSLDVERDGTGLRLRRLAPESRPADWKSLARSPGRVGRASRSPAGASGRDRA